MEPYGLSTSTVIVVLLGLELGEMELDLPPACTQMTLESELQIMHITLLDMEQHPFYKKQ